MAVAPLDGCVGLIFSGYVDVRVLVASETAGPLGQVRGLEAGSEGWRTLPPISHSHGIGSAAARTLVRLSFVLDGFVLLSACGRLYFNRDAQGGDVGEVNQRGRGKAVDDLRGAM